MAGVGGRHQHCIYLRRSAKFFYRRERIRDFVLFCRGFGFPDIAAGKRGDAAILGERETWHEPPDRVQTESDDAKVKHGFYGATKICPGVVVSSAEFDDELRLPLVVSDVAVEVLLTLLMVSTCRLF